MTKTSMLGKIINSLREEGVNSLVVKVYGWTIMRSERLRELVRGMYKIFSTSELTPRISKEKLFLNLNHKGNNVAPYCFPQRTSYLLTDQELLDSTRAKFNKAISNLSGLTDDEIASGVFYIYFECDSDAIPYLKKIQACGGYFVPEFKSSKTSYRFVNRLAMEAMKSTWAKSARISHLNNLVHENICEALWLTRHIEGDYVEIGVYLGGSALTAINFLDQLKINTVNSMHRKAWLLDTYDGFNYETARSSSDVIWAETHKLMGVEKTIEYISETLSESLTNFELVQNNICSDKLPVEISKIAVANIDVDMYEPVLAALNAVSSHMQIGGIIICEDAASTPALYGALLAMKQFLSSAQGRSYLEIFKGGQYFLLKMKDSVSAGKACI